MSSNVQTQAVTVPFRFHVVNFDGYNVEAPVCRILVPKGSYSCWSAHISKIDDSEFMLSVDDCKKILEFTSRIYPFNEVGVFEMKGTVQVRSPKDIDAQAETDLKVNITFFEKIRSDLTKEDETSGLSHFNRELSRPNLSESEYEQIREKVQASYFEQTKPIEN